MNFQDLTYVEHFKDSSDSEPKKEVNKEPKPKRKLRIWCKVQSQNAVAHIFSNI